MSLNSGTSMSIKETLGSQAWVSQHREQLRQLLPDTWTHFGNLNGLQIGFGLKLLGVDWRSQEEFGMCMAFLHKIGIFQVDGCCVRRCLS